jgi:hypothetical protein
MARLARVELFAADEIAVVHVMNRVVRRCFLLGDDAVTGKNYDSIACSGSKTSCRNWPARWVRLAGILVVDAVVVPDDRDAGPSRGRGNWKVLAESLSGETKGTGAILFGTILAKVGILAACRRVV